MPPIAENQIEKSKANLPEENRRAADLRRKVFIINCRLYMFVGAASIIIGVVMIGSAHRSASGTGITHDPALNFIAAIMMVFGVIRIAVARRQLAKMNSSSIK